MRFCAIEFCDDNPSINQFPQTAVDKLNSWLKNHDSKYIHEIKYSMITLNDLPITGILVVYEGDD